MKTRIMFMVDGIALSHVVRMQYLYNSLDESKYDLYFAASPQFRGFTKGMKNVIELDSLTVQEFYKRINRMAFKEIYDIDTMNQYIKTDLDLFEKYKPDVVVGDLRISLGISTKVYGIPFVNVQNAYWSLYTTIKEPAIPDMIMFHYLPKYISKKIVMQYYPKIERDFSLAYNQKCDEYELANVKTLNEFYSTGDMNLYVDIPLLSPTVELPDTERYIGPVLEFMEVPLPDFWDSIPEDKPLVYCSIGSTGSVEKNKFLIKTLKELDVSVLLVTAGKDLSGTLPDNFYACQYVPALKVIERASLVIFNGGSGTLYQAMSKGKPIMALPTSMDQYFACTQVEKMGLGKILDYKMLHSKKLKKWIQDLIENSTWQNNCQKVEEEINRYNSSVLFVQAMDEFISELKH